jgi:two-component system sensor histidine kinase GlrK
VSTRDGEERVVLVSVSDTGHGIPQEDLGQIFDRFKRIHTGRGTIRGTGLGLSIAKHIVTDHGGKIWAESTPGKGSTFSFTLPVV